VLFGADTHVTDMHYVDLFLLLAFGLAIWLWQDTARAKELASQAGNRACNRVQVEFLDETVEFTDLRLARDAGGRLCLQRRYRFEFSSDGSRRYQGRISMLGHQLESLDMEAYRENI
jgi:hypothetical protein